MLKEKAGLEFLRRHHIELKYIQLVKMTIDLLSLIQTDTTIFKIYLAFV